MPWLRYLPLAAIIVALGMTGLAVWQITETPGAVIKEAQPSPAASPAPGQPVLVPIEAGDTPEEIGEKLEELGVINSATHFRILVALLGYQQLLQAGDYEFEADTPTLEAVRRIRQGRTSPLQVAIPEGLRRQEMAAILEKEGVVSAEAFLAASEAAQPLAQGFDFLAGLPEDASLEGYLFPATYGLRHNMSGQEVVAAFLDAFAQNVTPELRQEAADTGFFSFHTIVTLASIVEREAKVAEERPIIAQVFLKRLRLAMPLEADPTVQYALANDPANVERYGYWKQELTEADLGVDSPYNTYRNKGLPPGPIASPGLASIIAVIRPAATNYLYFVAKPDGSHAFAETLEEHLENVEKYRRR